MLCNFYRCCFISGVWQNVLGPIEEMRRANDQVKIFPSYLNGEDLFGLTEPVVLRIIESVSESNTRMVLVYPIYTPSVPRLHLIYCHNSLHYKLYLHLIAVAWCGVIK